MKKIIALSVALLLTVPVISSCSTKEKLRVYNAAEYIDPSVIKEFEKEYNVKVVYDTFDDNENMYAKISHDETAYDVVVPSDYMIDCLIQEDRLQKLDLTKIPNFANIADEYKYPEYDPENSYTVPYMVGTLGILYNADELKFEPTSWKFLFDETYSGEIYMLDSMRDAICVGQKYYNTSVNDYSKATMSQVEYLLTEQKKVLQAYITDEIKDKMVLGEGIMALTYSGEARLAMDENPSLNYTVPMEGSCKWADGFVILKTSQKADLAHKFIDFMCRKDIAARNMAETGYTSPIKDDMDIDLDDIVRYPTQEILDRCEPFLYSAEATAMYSQVWERVRAN